MKLQSAGRRLIVLVTVMSALSALVTLSAFSQLDERQQSLENLVTATKAISEIHQTSAKLGSAALTYRLTGVAQHADEYLQELLNGRRRDNALRTLSQLPLPGPADAALNRAAVNTEAWLLPELRLIDAGGKATTDAGTGLPDDAYLTARKAENADLDEALSYIAAQVNEDTQSLTRQAEMKLWLALALAALAPLAALLVMHAFFESRVLQPIRELTHTARLGEDEEGEPRFLRPDQPIEIQELARALDDSRRIHAAVARRYWVAMTVNELRQALDGCPTVAELATRLLRVLALHLPLEGARVALLARDGAESAVLASRGDLPDGDELLAAALREKRLLTSPQPGSGDFNDRRGVMPIVVGGQVEAVLRLALGQGAGPQHVEFLRAASAIVTEHFAALRRSAALPAERPAAPAERPSAAAGQVASMPGGTGDEMIRLDLEEGLACVGQQTALYRTILSTFLQHHATSFDAARAAYARADWSGLRHIAHRARGASASIGAKAMAWHWEQIEAQAQKNPDRRTMGTRINALSQEYQASIAVVQSTVARLH